MFNIFKKKKAKNNEPLGNPYFTYKIPEKQKYKPPVDVDALFGAITPCKKEKSINLLCIADTHGDLSFSTQLQKKLYDELNMGCDAVLCLGDIRKDELKIIAEEVDGKYPIYGIKGNHDDIDQFYESPEIIDIDKKIINVNGVRIFGLEGSLIYIDGRPGYTQEQSINICKNADEADIVVTHSHIWRDDDVERSENDVHVGLIGPAYYFYKHKCFLNIHGHDHICSENDTVEIKNCGKSIGVYKIERITA